MVKRGDWVSCLSDEREPGKRWIGFVKRLARDGSWADVDWGPHVKRMRTAALRVETTIELVGELRGWEVTDLMREEELRAERELRAEATKAGGAG